jgi:hypothetical protein
MPQLRYWFTGSVLWLLASFALNIILALIGIRPMIPDKIFFFLFGVVLLVMFIGWWATAREGAASAKRDEKLDTLQATLDLIKGDLPTLDNSATKNISQLSNEQLRSRVSELAAAMRTFEAGYKDTQAQEAVPRILPPDTPQEQRQAAWNARMSRMTSHSMAAQSQFRIQFLPQALALREALCNKLGIMPPYQTGRVALDVGMMAGVSPVSDAADYLESLARRLPR